MALAIVIIIAGCEEPPRNPARMLGMAVKSYCAVPKHFRGTLRNVAAAETAPNRIEIHCAADDVAM